MKRRFRNVFMKRKRKYRLAVLPKIKIRLSFHVNGSIHYKFGYYGKLADPTQYDKGGKYVIGQPFYCFSSGTMYRPDFSDRWNKELRRHLVNYLKMNVDNIHPADVAL